MISFSATVTGVEERTKKVWLRGIGKEAEFQDRSEGWWLVCNKEFSIWVGWSRPEFTVGDRVKFTIAQE